MFFKLVNLFSLLLCCSLTFAEQTLQFRTIAVAPYGIININNNEGIYYDLVNTLTDNSILGKNLKINHQIYPYARIIHELKNGQTDLAILFKYQELEQHVSYISALPSLPNVVIGLNGNQFETIQSLEGKTLAYLRGASFSDLIDTNDRIKRITTKDFQQGIDLLSVRRVDAIIGPMDPILSAAQSLSKPKDFFGVPLVVSNRTPWVQISNKSSLISSKDILKKHFDQILSDGNLDDLRKKYLSHSRHIIE